MGRNWKRITPLTAGRNGATLPPIRRDSVVGPPVGSGTAGPFVITGVSQTSGTIDGGTVVTVTATGIIGTPTSTLGAVSNVLAGSFKITTSAHAAGSFSWTATNGNGSVSAPQSYVYLAHPAFSAISPNNGPQTIATTGVTVTCSNLPASGSGCPVSVTVDGNPCTSVVLVDGSHLTCTVPTDTTSGAKSVVVSVDGKTTTGAGAWTYNPPPSDLSATAIGQFGGSGDVTGLNFVSGMTGVATINGTPTTLTVNVTSATAATYVLAPGNYTTGTWPLKVTNPDGQSDTETIFEIVAESTPQTILGANLKLWYEADTGVSVVGGVVSQWNDQSVNACNLTAAGSARPTFNASSANFNGLPSITFDGVANTLSNAAGPSLGSNTLTWYICARLIGTSNAGCVIVMANTGGGPQLMITSGKLLRCYYSAASPAAATVVSNPTGPFACYGTIAGTGANSETSAINVGNMTEIAGSVGNSPEPGTGPMGQISVGGQTGQGFTNLEIVGVVAANVTLSSTQKNQLYSYWNFKYKLDAPISFTRSTWMLATTGNQFRIAGGGFNSTTGVQVVVSGTPTAVTTKFESQGSVSLTGVPSLAAGTYDVIITNANSGAALVEHGGLTVSATKRPDTILGNLLCVWGRSDQVNLNGSTVASYVDLACLGNVIAQATPASQPTYTASNPNFNGQPTLTYTGTQTMQCATVQFDDSTSETSWSMAVYRDSSATGTQVVLSNPDQLRNSALGAGVPVVRPSGSGTGATWTSAVTTTLAAVYFYNQFVSPGVYNSGINVALLPSGWGTEQTSTNQTGTNAGTGRQMNVGSNGAGAQFFLGDQGEILECDGMPSPSQISDLATYAAAFWA